VTEIGSAPTPPGWYPDPWNISPQRWWDGTEWSGHVAPVVGYVSGPATQASPGGWGPSQAATSPEELFAKETKAATWLTRAAILQAGINAAFAVVVVSLFREVFRSLEAQTSNQFGPGYSARGAGFSLRLSPLFSLVGLGGWVYVGVRIWWTYRTTTNGKLLGFRQQYDPGLTAAAWILPVVKWWFPYVGIRDSMPPNRRPKLLPWWWASTLLSSLLAMVAGAILAATVGWWLGAIVALMIGLGHAWIEHRVASGVLAAHRTLFGL
jgi:Protein of unknown function (DUF2510)